MFASGKKFCANTAIIFYLCFITCSTITSTLADCRIDLPQDDSLRPILYKYIGSHRVKINSSAKAVVKIKEEQKIEANCDLYFKTPNTFQHSSKMYIKCKGSFLYMSTNFDVNEKNYNQYYYGDIITECFSPNIRLYESIDNFEWCAANVTSYDLARLNLWNPQKSRYSLLAGICFDIYTNSFNSIYYALGPNKTEDMQPHSFNDSYDVGLALEYITGTFGSNSISATVFQDDQYKIWVKDYDFDSIIQHPQLGGIFNEEFATLLEFMWWTNLRIYNWPRYAKALENHIDKDKKSYDVLAGVSGAIKVPILESCQKKYSLQEVIFDTNRRIPQYVWNYLQDRSNNSNQIVIIGLNSPFYEISSQHDIIFCPDKCQEISWLNETSSSFRFSTMGIIFCCSVQDVRISRRLDGFPEYDFLPEPATTTELPNEVDVEAAELYDSLDDN